MNSAPRIRNIVKRTTLIVRDMEKSRRWYEHVLGMSTWIDMPYTLSGKGIAAGKKGDVTHLVIMKCDDPRIGMIGLLQWVDPPLPAPEIPTSVGYGTPVFVVDTEDAAEVARRAAELGTRVHTPERTFSVRGSRGETRHLLGCAIFDPDGYFYECNQVLRIDDPEDAA
ncbi:VOC family protein [Candidatus Foliamicus sp.]